VRAPTGAIFAVCLLACSGPDPVIVATTVLGSTHDVVGPYHVDSVILSATGDDTVELMLSIDTSAANNFSALSMADDDELYRGTIAGQSAGTDVFYFVRVTRDGEVVARDPASAVAQSYGFQVLRPDGACIVDSECALGAETCVDGACTPIAGTCTDTEQCPAGYRCDVETGTCLLHARSCDSDLDCPTSDHCAAGECAPRHLCSDVLPCPDDFTCNVALGRCYAD